MFSFVVVVAFGVHGQTPLPCNGAGTVANVNVWNFADGTLQNWTNVIAGDYQYTTWNAAPPSAITAPSGSYVIAPSPLPPSVGVLAAWAVKDKVIGRNLTHGDTVQDFSGNNRNATFVLNRFGGQWKAPDTWKEFYNAGECKTKDLGAVRLISEAILSFSTAMVGYTDVWAHFTYHNQVMGSVHGDPSRRTPQSQPQAFDPPIEVDGVQICDYNLPAQFLDLILTSPVPEGAITVRGPQAWGSPVALQLTGDGISFSPDRYIPPNGGSVMSAPGVYYEYYELQGSTASIASINFEQQPTLHGAAKNFDLSLADRDDFFAFRFRGQLNVPLAGVYYFHLQSDDGSTLSIDGMEVINFDGLHDITTSKRSPPVQMIAGLHEIEVKYFDWEVDQELIVQWEGPGRPTERIPDSALSHRISALPIDFQANQSFTLEAVIQTTADGTRAILSKAGQSDEDSGWWWRLEDGLQQFGISNGDENRIVTGWTPLNDGLWHHIAAVRDVRTKELRLYVDSMLDGIGTDPTTGFGTLANSYDILIGLFHHSQHEGFQANGSFDLVRISLGAHHESQFSNPIQGTIMGLQEVNSIALCSPIFRLSAGFSATVSLLGGHGVANAPDGNLTQSPFGFLGAALQRVSDGVFVSSVRRPTSSANRWTRRPLSPPATPDGTDTEYRVCVLDSYQSPNVDTLDWIIMGEVSVNNVQYCHCNSGRGGALCQYSDEVTCHGHGSVAGDGSCECGNGYYGAQCDSVCAGFNEADPSTLCSGHGTCDQSSTSGCVCDWWYDYPNSTCERCRPGVYGSDCGNLCPSAASFFFEEAPCNSHGTCDDGQTGTGVCKCERFWGGDACTDTVSQVSTPVPGSLLQRAAWYPITWNTQGNVPNVAIECAFAPITNSSRWTRLAVVNNTGMFRWWIPEFLSENEYAVRVISTTNPNLYSISGVFAVTAFRGEGTVPHQPTAWEGALVTLAIVLIILAVILVLCLWKRKAIGNWLLWKLGANRFGRLVETNPAEDGVEMGDHIAPPPALAAATAAASKVEDRNQPPASSSASSSTSTSSDHVHDPAHDTR